MKVHNSLIDDAGQKWEFLLDEHTHYVQDEATGQHVAQPTIVKELRYKKPGDTEWSVLPSWATIREEWMINLCLFDEDEETGELTFWQIEPSA